MAEELKKVLQRNLLASLRKSDFEEASKLLETLRDEDPLSVETRGLELEFLIGSKKYDEAEPLAKQLVELFPGSARILYLAGRLAYRLKRYTIALGHFRESARIHPHWLTSLFLGKTLTQMGGFDEAESILIPLVSEYPTARLDISWLYERKGEFERALREIEKYLEKYPDEEFARNQQQRLRAKCLGPEEIIDEVDSLREHGEEVDENVLPEYIEGLLRAGQGAKAREAIENAESRFALHTVVRIGWNCYRLQAYDLALQMFKIAFPRNLGNAKFLSAFERAAQRCGRVEDISCLYDQHASEEPRLYGRLRRLKSNE